MTKSVFLPNRKSLDPSQALFSAETSGAGISVTEIRFSSYVERQHGNALLRRLDGNKFRIFDHFKLVARNGFSTFQLFRLNTAKHFFRNNFKTNAPLAAARALKFNKVLRNDKSSERFSNARHASFLRSCTIRYSPDRRRQNFLRAFTAEAQADFSGNGANFPFKFIFVRKSRSRQSAKETCRQRVLYRICVRNIIERKIYFRFKLSRPHFTKNEHALQINFRKRPRAKTPTIDAKITTCF